ncbi:MAG: hypothetical protein IJD51_05045 [Clostridia bacterium]|nr:hypothetical protein [Clostridia bacterium]
MKFFKENSYDIVKIYITQIGIAIFSFMLSTGAGMISPDSSVSKPLQLILSIFSFGFFYALLFYSAWEWGAKDKIRMDSGRLTGNGLKGLFMGLFANIPNLILTAISIISYTVCLGNGSKFFASVGGVCSLIYRFTANMYHGTVQACFSFLKDGDTNLVFFLVEAIAFLVFSLLSTASLQIGYVLGVKKSNLFGKKKKYE